MRERRVNGIAGLSSKLVYGLAIVLAASLPVMAADNAEGAAGTAPVQETAGETSGEKKDQGKSGKKTEINVVSGTEEAKAKVTAATKRPIKDKWAVVIGVNNFQDKSIPTLRYAAKDAQDFAKFLVKKANFAEDHVLLLLNEDATRNNIFSALGDSWLPKRALKDDLIVIYASSHGSPKEIDVGGDNFLIAHDTSKKMLFTTGIRLQDLAPTIKQRTHCDRIVLILDACNSGAAQAGGKGLFRSSNFNVEALAGKGQIVISSSSANQRSWESKRYKNGVFTRSLIQVLDRGKEANSHDLDSAFGVLKDKVESEVKFDRKAFQTPVMRSKWQGDPLKLTAKPVAPRSIPKDDEFPYTYNDVINRKKTKPKPVVTARPKPVATTPKVETPRVKKSWSISDAPSKPTAIASPTKPVAIQPPVIRKKKVEETIVITTPVEKKKTRKQINVPTGQANAAWEKFMNR